MATGASDVADEVHGRGTAAQLAVVATLRAIVRDEVPDGPLPEGLLATAGYHGITSLVRHARPDLPGVDEAFLREQGERMRILHDLAFVAPVLEPYPWAVVKGPVLSELVYRQAGRRGFGDLDVLVAPTAFGDALAALEAQGATLLDLNWALAARQRRSEISLRLPSGSMLDLHWSLLNEVSTRRVLRLPDLLVDRRPARLGSVDAWRLAPVDALIHVCLHAVLSGGHRLIWVRDIVESLDKVPADELLARAADLGLTLPVATMLRRVASVTGTPAPSVPGGWGALMATAARRLPPGRGPDLRPTGATIVASTRTTTALSLLAVARRFGDRRALHVLGPELAVASDDGSRAQYLELLCSGTTR